MKKKVKELMKFAFLDRDGTLLFEPQDTFQLERFKPADVLPGVVEGLSKLSSSGYKLVVVTNQDGLGTKSLPQKTFDAVQDPFLRLLKKEGIEFYRVCICPHLPKENCACRKPKIGLVKDMKDSIDLKRSFVVGDRPTDAGFAEGLGVTFFKAQTNAAFPRLGVMERATKETDIFALCNLDGTGQFRVKTGMGFFDHMLEQLSKHSLIDLTIAAKGDLHIDEHHTVEDVGLALGAALSSALGDRRGIQRYGFLLPMDDTLVEVAVDLGGRPYLVFNCEFKRERVGELPTEMIGHFFRSLAETLKANIHINVRYSKNEHHKIEAIFKAIAKTLRTAVENDTRAKGVLPSTKGLL